MDHIELKERIRHFYRLHHISSRRGTSTITSTDLQSIEEALICSCQEENHVIQHIVSRGPHMGSLKSIVESYIIKSEIPPEQIDQRKNLISIADVPSSIKDGTSAIDLDLIKTIRALKEELKNKP